MSVNRLEALSILKILDILADNLSEALGSVSDKELQMLAPTPFSPASEEFSQAADKLSDLLFTAAEADAAIAEVREAIEQNRFANQTGSVVNVAARRIKELATLLFA